MEKNEANTVFIFFKTRRKIQKLFLLKRKNKSRMQRIWLKVIDKINNSFGSETISIGIV